GGTNTGTGANGTNTGTGAGVILPPLVGGFPERLQCTTIRTDY
ncbi:unnamed protein product, partial [Didymodactylos carnosus]